MFACTAAGRSTLSCRPVWARPRFCKTSHTTRSRALCAPSRPQSRAIMPTCIVVDLGGTFLRCALVGDKDALTAAERIRLPDDAVSRTSAVWDNIVDAIAAYARRHSTDVSSRAPIAFAFPGPIVGGVPTAAPTVLGGLVDTPDIGARLADAS